MSYFEDSSSDTSSFSDPFIDMLDDGTYDFTGQASAERRLERIISWVSMRHWYSILSILFDVLFAPANTINATKKRWMETAIEMHAFNVGSHPYETLPDEAFADEMIELLVNMTKAYVRFCDNSGLMPSRNHVDWFGKGMDRVQELFDKYDNEGGNGSFHVDVSTIV